MTTSDYESVAELRLKVKHLEVALADEKRSHRKTKQDYQRYQIEAQTFVDKVRNQQ